MSKALLTVASLLDIVAGPNLNNKDFLPQSWNKYIKSMKSLQLRMAICKAVNIEGIVPLPIRTSNLHLHAWFGTVEDLAVDVLLGMSFIERCVRGILPTERKIVSWHSSPVAIILTKTAIDYLHSEYAVFNVNTNSLDDASSDELNLCRVARQVTLPANTHVAVFVSCQGFGVMNIEIQGYLVECRCSMTAQVLMEILPGRPFYVYIPKYDGQAG